MVKSMDLADEFEALLAPEVTLPVAAVKVLIGVIRRSEATTWMGLQEELREVSRALPGAVRERSLLGCKSTIAITSGCELFLRYVTRSALEIPDFAACKQQVLQRGEKFAEMSVASRKRIAGHGHPFVRDGAVVLTHGHSRVVTGLLLEAARTKHFSVVIPEGRPDCAGVEAAGALSRAGIPVSLVVDAAVGYWMERVDLCVVGAEGVAESGGVVNKVGTFQIAVLAKALNKPFYVAAESYKFARIFPLNQRDMPEGLNPSLPLQLRPDGSAAVPAPAGVNCPNPCVDYTPAAYITLLFTDLGVLTPAAVSDELIRLYS